MASRSHGMPLVATCVVLLLFTFVSGDMYLRVPRGSNNRLNEKSANRANAQRLFNSQNNNRGGYNVGDAKSEPAKNANEQYMMKYFQSGPWKTLTDDLGKSQLAVEWTNQHGCGGNEDSDPQKQNCVIVMQYMCQDEGSKDIDAKDVIRNGFRTNTNTYTNADKKNVMTDRKKTNVKMDLALHESWDWYNKCYLRKRNHGLFTADKTLTKRNRMGQRSAIFTRQNQAGTRYGYECQEERDYFPYWHPTPWTDVAVFAENSSMCSHYTEKSFNVRPYGECVEPKGWTVHNNARQCEAYGGKWHQMHNYLEKATDKTSKESCENSTTSTLQYKWAVPYDSKNRTEECLVMLDKPHCSEAPWSRPNHLGNGKNGTPLSFKWTLPHFPSGKEKKCVFRIRYNISTDDYNPYHADYKLNGRGESPILPNPRITVMRNESALRMAINTAQFGRVFQDRSHAFVLRPRPAGLEKARIFNVNVRGKRGNIVQTFPATEYDFTPNSLKLKANDLVHFQWTGSNTHNNGNPAGAGQGGSAGEGKAGSDRHNVVEMSDLSGNFPTPFAKSAMWHNVKVEWIYHGKNDVTPRDLAINMASSGYYRCADNSTCPEEEHKNYLVSTKAKMNNLLDNAPASYEGVLLRFLRPGTHHYMCTRNNNFSNRSQKATIVVV